MIATALNKEIVLSRPISKSIGIAIFVALTTLGAFVRIPLPFTPVPITLQTFFVILAGLILGANCGTLSQAIYLVLGASGLSIFAAGNFGLSYLLGPTGGYILGFVISSFAVGKLSRMKDLDLFRIFLISLFGSLLILLCGAGWLAVILNYSLKQAFYLGIVPFLIGDVLKAGLASVIYLKIHKRAVETF